MHKSIADNHSEHIFSYRIQGIVEISSANHINDKMSFDICDIGCFQNGKETVLGKCPIL